MGSRTGRSAASRSRPSTSATAPLIQVAIATLASDRALMLVGEPGTAKSWLSEHLAAAISGNSALIVQGTAGTSEEHIKYGWNYALLLAEGPIAAGARAVADPARDARRASSRASRRSPARSSEVQDALISDPLREADRDPRARRGRRAPSAASTSSRPRTPATAASTR